MILIVQQMTYSPYRLVDDGLSASNGRMPERLPRVGRVLPSAQNALLRHHRPPLEIGVAPTRMKATSAGSFERLLQAWLVARWMSTSPAFMEVSPSSITAQISPDRTMA